MARNRQLPYGFEAEITFFNELNDFLPRSNRDKPILVRENTRRSLKDLIESLGVPHTELGAVQLNGEPVNIYRVIESDCRIEVYPQVMGRSGPLHAGQGHGLRFLADVHLGTLARNLRLLGVDTRFNRDWADLELASISSRENRILLTRDRRLLMRKIIRQGSFIRNSDPDQQVFEVLNRFGLKENCRPFTRCLLCNGLLKPLNQKRQPENLVENQVPLKVRHWCREFTICENCQKVYWKGSHYERLNIMVNHYLS